jgi:hypothetical protein
VVNFLWEHAKRLSNAVRLSAPEHLKQKEHMDGMRENRQRTKKTDLQLSFQKSADMQLGSN